MKKESPDYLRMSTAASITLGFKSGLFYRNAKLYCINLLLTYEEGCSANCAYCGLSLGRKGRFSKKSFIRVEWPTYALRDIIERMIEKRDGIKRVCISMITNKRAVKDTKFVTRYIAERVDLPISLLVTPTILSRDDIVDFKELGADMLGIAFDAATPELFNLYRGSGVSGPHKWKRYFTCFKEGISVFGERMVGVHLIVGLNETEREMVKFIQEIYDMGGQTHLFSFFPEPMSRLAHYPQPPMGQYRRIQLARFLIDKGIDRAERFKFDIHERIVDFGLPRDELLRIVERGTPFMTSGCPGRDGEVACTRPYANSLPGPDIRNFPFPPGREDIEKIKRELEIERYKNA
ncbi:MAG: radical SAM protein [bacterium]|nr:radical SAM protein [bacterium]